MTNGAIPPILWPMAVPMKRHVMSAVGELRFDPLLTRVRGEIGGALVVDSAAALLVWEPRRILPTYAVPATHIRGELVPVAEPAATAQLPDAQMMDGPPVLNPDTPFAVHSCPGVEFDIRHDARVTKSAAYRLHDPALGGVIELDFHAFDRWLEEDEQTVGHPRDPFHRIDVWPTSRRIEVQRDGVTLACSDHARVLTETMLPARYYLPRQDVRLDVLAGSLTSTVCAYKGTAAYYALDGEDLAWTYEAPLNDAAPVGGDIAFFNERVDILIDGTLVERPRTPWSR